MSTAGGPALTKSARAYVPLPLTSPVTSARYDWVLAKGQQLLAANPLLMPVMGLPPKDTAAFAVGSLELLGLFQNSSARVTGPEMPVTVMVPVPSPPLMRPNPNDAKSVFNTDSNAVGGGTTMSNGCEVAGVNPGEVACSV